MAANLSASMVTTSSLLDQLDSIEQLLQSGHGDELREEKIGLLLLSTLRECILVSSGNDVEKIAKRILDLFVQVSGTEVSVQELRLLLGLFHVQNSPIDLLTWTLCEITSCKSSSCDDDSSTRSVRRVHYIEFPRVERIPIESSLDSSIHKNVLSHRNDHIKQSISSGWSHSALCIPVNDTFSGKSSAITFSTWISLKKPDGSEMNEMNDTCVHLISLAYDNSWFTVWIDFKRRKLKYVIGKMNQLISEATETSFCDEFSFEKLTHVVIIWELVSGSLKVKVNVNGEFINRSCTTFPSNMFSIESLQLVFLGSCQESELSYKLFPIKMFSKPLNWHEMVSLFLLGPDGEIDTSSLSGPSMQELRVQEISSTNPNLGPKIVEEFIQNPVLFSSCKNSLSESLCFQYPSKSRFLSCDTILLPQNWTNQKDGQKNFSPKNVRKIPVIPFVDSSWKTCGEIINSISDVGGINCILFLLARVFELSNQTRVREEETRVKNEWRKNRRWWEKNWNSSQCTQLCANDQWLSSLSSRLFLNR